MENDRDRFGWTGDLWEEDRAGTQYEAHGDPWADQVDRPCAEVGDISKRHGAACRNFGVAALVLGVLAFAGLGPVAAGAALVFARMAGKNGLKARAAGIDGRDIKIGTACRVAALAAAWAYIIFMLIGLAFLFAVFGGMFRYAGMYQGM